MKEKLKTLIPLEKLEYEAQQQIYNALNLDFLVKLAIMPDCHTGYTLPIGGVALLDGVISPVYVGYDIGCGMCNVILPVKARELLKTKKIKTKILNEIYDIIPVGLAIERRNPVDYFEFKSASSNKDLNKKVNKKLYNQLGTLGSGNHFIEIGEDFFGDVVITIHSGSRNIGWSIAQYYMNLSKLVDVDLPSGFLSLYSEYGQQYLHDLNFALNYALENRKTMMWEVLMILGLSTSQAYEAMNNMVNENHNHAVVTDNHVLHRKGATPAEKDQIGIIPGSMKAGVYITKGLGNEDYLKSASHGAGRKMSRKKAKEKIDLNYVKKQMKGIVAKIDKNILDEAPDAYKDLEEVINMQEDIVIKTINFIKPLINVKG